MKIYISGQITGLDLEHAKALFKNMEERIRSTGHEPVNPMEVLPYQPHYTWHDYMAEEIKALLFCDAILMLPNWRESKGAKIEHSIAEGLGLKMFYTENHILFSND